MVLEHPIFIIILKKELNVDDYTVENQLYIDDKSQCFLYRDNIIKDGKIYHGSVTQGHFLDNNYKLGYLTDCYRYVYDWSLTRIFRTEFLNQEISIYGDNEQSLRRAKQFAHPIDDENRLYKEFSEDTLSKSRQMRIYADNSRILEKWIDISKNEKYAESIDLIHNLLLVIAIQSIHYNPQTSNVFIIQDRNIVKYESSDPHGFDIYNQIGMILDTDQKIFRKNNKKNAPPHKIELQLNPGEINIYFDEEILFSLTQAEIGKIILAGNTNSTKLKQTRFHNPFIIYEFIKTFYSNVESVIPFPTTSFDIESFSDLKQAAEQTKYYTHFSYH